MAAVVGTVAAEARLEPVSPVPGPVPMLVPEQPQPQPQPQPGPGPGPELSRSPQPLCCSSSSWTKVVGS